MGRASPADEADEGEAEGDERGQEGCCRRRRSRSRCSRSRCRSRRRRKRHAIAAHQTREAPRQRAPSIRSLARCRLSLSLSLSPTSLHPPDHTHTPEPMQPTGFPRRSRSATRPSLPLTRKASAGSRNLTATASSRDRTAPWKLWYILTNPTCNPLPPPSRRRRTANLFTCCRNPHLPPRPRCQERTSMPEPAHTLASLETAEATAAVPVVDRRKAKLKQRKAKLRKLRLEKKKKKAAMPQPEATKAASALGQGGPKDTVAPGAQIAAQPIPKGQQARRCWDYQSAGLASPFSRPSRLALAARAPRITLPCRPTPSLPRQPRSASQHPRPNKRLFQRQPRSPHRCRLLRCPTMSMPGLRLGSTCAWDSVWSSLDSSSPRRSRCAPAPVQGHLWPDLSPLTPTRARTPRPWTGGSLGAGFAGSQGYCCRRAHWFWQNIGVWPRGPSAHFGTARAQGNPSPTGRA